jgi:hypothetical protein
LKIPELPSAKAVSTKRLRSVWKRISDKPFPDVYAFTFDENDFFHMLNLLQKNPGVTDTRLKEYGISFGNKHIEACTFQFKEQMIILVKQTAPLIDCLEHELRHIHSGDFALEG